MGLRERKKEETRSALAWAAIRLIVERGYDQVLVEDIAEEAGVSPRTFNNYFPSKAAAVASRQVDRVRRIAVELRERPADEDLWPAITEAVVAQTVPGPEVTAHPRPDRATWAAGLQRMLAVPAIQAEILRAASLAEDEIAEAVGQRVGLDPHQDIYPRLVATAVTGAFNVTSSWHTANGSTGSIRDLLTDALGQISAGLPPPQS